jgi:hypothetical protein
MDRTQNHSISFSSAVVCVGSVTDLNPATSGLVMGEMRSRIRVLSSWESAVIRVVHALIQPWGFWMAELSLSNLLSNRCSHKTTV